MVLESALPQVLDDLAAGLQATPTSPVRVDPDDWAGALDLITTVLDSPVGGEPGDSAHPDGGRRPMIALATAALGVLLAEMRADLLAVRYLERARTLVPAEFGRTRVNVLQTLLGAMIRTGRVDGAAEVFAEMELAVPIDAADRRDLLLVGRAALALADGRPDRALAILDGPDGNDVTLGASAQLLRVRALNLVGRHRQVVTEMLDDKPGSGLDENAKDEDCLVELAKATLALGDLAQTFELEKRAFAIRSRRELLVTALLPVIDEMAMWGILDGTQQELSERTVDDRRINNRFDQLTEQLFDNLLSRVYALDGAIRRAEDPIDEVSRSEIRTRAQDLEAVVAALDQRPHPTPPGSGGGPDDVVGRICRTLEPTAAQLGVRVEALSGPALRSRRAAPWHMYSTWRSQLLRAIQLAEPGRTLAVSIVGSDLVIE